MSIGMTKRLLIHEQSMDFAAAIEVEAVAQALLLRAKDHRTLLRRVQGRQDRAVRRALTVASDYATRYGLTAEEEAWRAKAEAFARMEVAPLAREADRARRFPVELLPRMAALGLLGAPLPKADGGGGAGALANALISEEIGRVDGSVRGFLAVHVGPRVADGRRVRDARAEGGVAAAARLGRGGRVLLPHRARRGQRRRGALTTRASGGRRRRS